MTSLSSNPVHCLLVMMCEEGNGLRVMVRRKGVDRIVIHAHFQEPRRSAILAEFPDKVFADAGMLIVAHVGYDTPIHPAELLAW